MSVNDDEEVQNNPHDLIALKLAAELEKGEATLADLQQLVDSNNNITPGVIAQCKELIKKRMTQQSSAHQSSSSASDTPVGQPPREPEDDKTRVVKYERETAPTSVTLNSFADFTYHIQNSQCRTCKEPFFSSELDIRTLFQDWTDGRANKLTSDLKCKSCGTYSCIACIPKPFSRSSRIGFQHKKQHVSWCCVGGRLFIFWVLLCGFDRHLQESRNIGSKVNKTKSDANLKKSNINKKGKKPKSSGSHFLGQNFMPRGMGYGSASYDFNFDKLEDIDMADYMELMKTHQFLQEPVNSPYHSNPSSSRDEKANDKEMAMDAQVKEDKFGVLLLGLLTDLLPSLLRETSFDLDPPPAVIEMLRRSRVLNYCAELLRNDSLIDIVKRVDMYQTLFNFMTTMGSHSGTCEGLLRPRPNRPEAVDLLTSSFYAALPEQEEQAPALSECLDNLIKQSSLVLESAKSKEDDFASEDGQTLLRICHQVLELAQFIEANSREQGKVTAAAIPEVVVIKDVEDKDIFPRHKYALDARRLSFSQPGRFKRLITEITTLHTSLPPGIFVRYGENRPDVLKCIIVGPLGTPYENGIFEFDIFCGSTFPNDPPSVAFRGTGGGTVSINPNLYADGKVCLSLLGTWSGEPWEPGESTLLQVLISIQAMIFCEEPWYNEPGREIAYRKSITGTPSEKYNQRIQQFTVRYAILDWLEKAPELWKDVVMHHFTQHGNTILEKVEEWFSKNTSTALRTPDQVQVQHYDTFKGTYVSALEPPKTRPDMSSTVERLQTAMQKYGATYKIAYVPPPPEKQPSPQNIVRPQFGPSPTGFFEGYGAPPPTPTPTHPYFMSPQLGFPPGLFNPQPPAPSIPPSMHSHFQHGGHSPALPGYGGYMGGGQVPGTGTSSYNTWEHQMQSHGGSMPGNFAGPPSSNTRLAAARGRGGDAGGSSGRGGPFHPSPGAFGHGRGGPRDYVSGPIFGDPPRGGRGGGRGQGRGQGQGRGRGNTGGRGGG